MSASTTKRKQVRRAYVPLTLDKVEEKKLNALVKIDKSDRNKVLRKALDFAFENPQEALKPRI